MSDEESKKRSEADAELERQILSERKFSLEEAIGRMVGKGGMKGASPITRHEQAAASIQEYLGRHLNDSSGALTTVLHRRVRDSEQLLGNLDEPLVVLAGYLKRTLESQHHLTDLVREADMEWGRQFGERPYFQMEGNTAHPDDPYTVDSVRIVLAGLLETLPSPIT